MRLCRGETCLAQCDDSRIYQKSVSPIWARQVSPLHFASTIHTKRRICPASTYSKVRCPKRAPSRAPPIPPPSTRCRFDTHSRATSPTIRHIRRAQLAREFAVELSMPLHRTEPIECCPAYSLETLRQSCRQTNAHLANNHRDHHPTKRPDRKHNVRATHPANRALSSEPSKSANSKSKRIITCRL